MIKTVENVEYIIFQQSNVPWVYSKECNVYGVRALDEQRFIEHIILLRSLGLLSLLSFGDLTKEVNSLIIVYLAAYVFWECSVV